MGRHSAAEAITPPASVADARTTGVLYLTPRHPDRRRYRGVRRAPARVADRIAAANPLFTLAMAAVALAAVDTLIVLYARKGAGSFVDAFADIYHAGISVVADVFEDIFEAIGRVL